LRIFPKIGFRTSSRKGSFSKSRLRKPPANLRTLPSVGLLDLTSVVSSASSVETLYESLAAKVARTFSAPAVSLFVRDDESGDFNCCVSTALTAKSRQNLNGHLTLPSDAFVVRRLTRLISPLRVDADEMRIWELALKDGPSKILEQRLHERQILQETRSSLLVQLRTKNDLIGVLSLAEPASGQFNTEELSLLKSLSGQLALVLENTKLLQRLVEHERLRAQLAVAAEVQRGLLPAVNPTLPGVDLCAFCQPALHVGGDYYDFVSLPDGSMAICVADVAGKGIAAALLMAVVQASLRSRLSDTREHSVAEVAAVLNRHICASVSEARYVTCFYGELNTRDGSFRFVNAGHNPPILLRARHAEETGLLPELHRLSVGGTVLGLFPDLSFEEGRVSLQPRDILVAFTDGVTEAMNLQGEEFSDERLCEVIRNVSSRRASDILESIVSRVSEWAKGAVPHDDITVVVLALK